ncbi:hypothetical protein TI04_04435 [Achromatium sp. WMS2]|nr:hypothetical protein TI04_04435 [Achromatium sp. WMS2]
MEALERPRMRFHNWSIVGFPSSHRKTHQVESGGMGRKYMFLLGETWSVRVPKESAVAIVVMTTGASQEERKTKESRKNQDLRPNQINGQSQTERQECKTISVELVSGGISEFGWIPKEQVPRLASRLDTR